MTTLRTAPFSLTYGTLVVAKAQAYNNIGWGTLSSANTAGVTIQTEPS